MTTFKSVYLIMVSVAEILLLYVINVRLGKISANTVYVIWFSFSLSFCALSLFLLLNYVASPTFKPCCSEYLEYATVETLKFFSDIKFEIFLLILSWCILIVPQYLTYLICGLFGFGVRPRFISTITRCIYFLFIKALAALSGALASLACFKYYIPDLPPGSDIFNISNGLMPIFCASLYALFYWEVKDIIGKFFDNLATTPVFICIIAKMKRNINIRSKTDR